MAHDSASPENSEIPYGYCHCGCGQKTNIIKQSDPKKGRKKGEPSRYLPSHGARIVKPSLAYHIDPQTGCWIWLGSRDHYGKTSVNHKSRSAHRVFYEMHKGAIPPGMHLDHLCRNRYCVNPDHLEPVTNAENVRRGIATILNEDQVREIRALFGTVSKAEIGRRYGVSRQAISSISQGRNWKDIR